MPRAKENYPAHVEGNVYVQFRMAQEVIMNQLFLYHFFVKVISNLYAQAQTASAALSGRKFADRMVLVDYVSLYNIEYIADITVTISSLLLLCLMIIVR